VLRNAVQPFSCFWIYQGDIPGNNKERRNPILKQWRRQPYVTHDPEHGGDPSPAVLTDHPSPFHGKIFKDP